MRILVICHRFPFPPKRGGKIRPFNIIKHLHNSDNEVHVASLVRSDQEHAEIDGIKQYCSSYFSSQVNPVLQTSRMILKLATSMPSSMGYFYSAELSKHVNTLLATKKFDLIIAHCSSVAQYVSEISGIPKIIDFGDMDSQKWLEYSTAKPFPLSIGYGIEGRKLMAEEARLTYKFEMCTATTKGEHETLSGLNSAALSSWFPNGVDTSHFMPSEQHDKNLISFIGRMDYFPNQQAVRNFALEVFPIIKASKPSAKFVIVGAEPSNEIKALEQIEGIKVTGTVDDVRPFVSSSRVNVANLSIARGTQNKILEAMAMGVPVVASPAAAKGIDAEVGRDLLVGTSNLEIAMKIIELMNDDDLRKRLVTSARSQIALSHSWPESMKKLDRIIAHTVEKFSETQRVS
jgi:polysaccharide biosynthesis protein PslH